MKLFLKNIVVFSLFSLIFVIVGLILWGELIPLQLQHNLRYQRGGNGFMYTRIREIPKFKNSDILAIGSSRTYRGLDPRVFKKAGITLFNLGSSAQTPIETELLLKRYLDTINPKLVILEVSIFADDGVESATDIISNDKVGKDSVEMIITISNFKLYLSFIYSFWRQIFFGDGDFIEAPTKKDGSKYISGGYVEHPLKHQKKMLYTAREITMRRYQQKAFERTIAFLKKRKVKVLLVRLPITSELYNSYENIDEINKWIRTSNISFVSLQPMKLESERYFYDSQHLNQEGAEVVSRKIIGIVNSIR